MKRKKIFNVSPLAFGESNAKKRIKNVLNYKRSAFWMVFVAIIAVIVVGIGLLTDPIERTDSSYNKAAKDSNTVYAYEKESKKNIPLANIQDGTDEQLVFLLNSGKKTNRESIQDAPNEKNATLIKAGGENYYIYGKYSKYYVEKPYQFISEISDETYSKILGYIEPTAHIYDSIISELSTFPKEYLSEKAAKDGHFTVVHGKVISDTSIIDSFINNTKKGIAASVIIVQYTTEGDAILTKVVFDGTQYYGVSDNSRDKFKGEYEDLIKFQYKYMKVFKDEEVKQVRAVLLNDDSITIDKYNKSMLSSNSKDFIDHYFLYYYSF